MNSRKKIYESKRENVKCSGHTVRNSERIITSLYICVIFIYVQKYVTATKFHTRTKQFLLMEITLYRFNLKASFFLPHGVLNFLAKMTKCNVFHYNGRPWCPSCVVFPTRFRFSTHKEKITRRQYYKRFS